MKNSIISLLNENGYSNTGDNRNFSVRSLNTMIESGFLKLTFVSQEESSKGYGFHWLSKDNKKSRTLYTVEIFGKKYYGHFMPAFKKSNSFQNIESCHNEFIDEYSDIIYKDLDLYQILCRVASLISLNKNGFDFLKSGNCNCQKCNGRGTIPEFMHYADGICFDCAGTGIDKNELKANIDINIKI